MKNLTAENYIRTVKDLKFPARSEMRELGKTYNGADVYVKIRVELLTNSFGHTVFPAFYYYCERTEDFYCDEEMITKNDISMKNSYRRTKRLLTSDEIIGIRNKYGITQRDLCRLIGWGEKNITRYEGHQVQDFAHNSILRKLADDPAWFLSLLENSQLSLFVADKTRYKKS